MITAVDTNILLDILIPNAKFAEISKRLLDESLTAGALVISEVVYAELAAQFPTDEELNHFLTDTQIRLDVPLAETLAKAGAAWKVHKKARGEHLQCPKCGRRQRISCSGCGEVIAGRQHIMSDFLVGAHALVQADRLLTRDLGYYRTYFKELQLIFAE